jgi:hypothetical protein
MDFSPMPAWLADAVAAAGHTIEPLLRSRYAPMVARAFWFGLGELLIALRFGH